MIQMKISHQLLLFMYAIHCYTSDQSILVVDLLFKDLFIMISVSIPTLVILCIFKFCKIHSFLHKYKHGRGKAIVPSIEL